MIIDAIERERVSRKKNERGEIETVQWKKREPFLSQLRLSERNGSVPLSLLPTLYLPPLIRTFLSRLTPQKSPTSPDRPNPHKELPRLPGPAPEPADWSADAPTGCRVSALEPADWLTGVGVPPPSLSSGCSGYTVGVSQEQQRLSSGLSLPSSLFSEESTENPTQ